MSREQAKRRLKLWLLALVLAVVLAWYILNPTPGAVRCERNDDPPDAKRLEVEAQAGESFPRLRSAPALLSVTTPSPAASGEELVEWPKYLELD